MCFAHSFPVCEAFIFHHLCKLACNNYVMSFPNILCSQAKGRGSLHRGVCAAQESSHFLSAQLKLLIYVISQSLPCKSACEQSNTTSAYRVPENSSNVWAGIPSLSPSKLWLKGDAQYKSFSINQ